MNPMLKIAYNLGCRKAVQDLGPTKTADSVGDFFVASDPVLSTVYAPDGRGWSRFGHGTGFSGLGAALGGGLGRILTKGRGGDLETGVPIVLGALGGTYGAYKGVRMSEEADSRLQKFLRAIGAY